MAIIKQKPVAKKAATVVKKAAPAPAKSAAPKTAAASNSKLKGSVKKTFDPAGLGAHQDVWAGTAPAERGAFGDIPDGKYDARIDEAIVDTGKEGDRLQVKWTYTITGPEFANRKVWQNTGLMDEKGIQITKGNFVTLGITPPDEITELPEVLEQVKNLPVEIALLTREGKGANAGKFFQNTFLNKLKDAGDDAPSVVEEKTSRETIEDGEWAGKKVKFENDGVEYTGTVVKNDEENAEIAVEGEEDHWEVPVSMLEEVEVDAAPAVDPNDFVGLFVQFSSDGKIYQGDVTGVDKTGNLIVVINDEEWGVGVEDVTVIEKPKPNGVKKVAGKPAMRSIKK